MRLAVSEGWAMTACPLFRQLSFRLPFDIARCHDDACPDRERCGRWVWREVCGPATGRFETGRG